ncbi:MAG: hypothetical protein ACI89X_001189 [Planctomycetota bacterium]|jgi:hypothetical protein
MINESSAVVAQCNRPLRDTSLVFNLLRGSRPSGRSVVTVKQAAKVVGSRMTLRCGADCSCRLLSPRS